MKVVRSYIREVLLGIVGGLLLKALMGPVPIPAVLARFVDPAITILLSVSFATVAVFWRLRHDIWAIARHDGTLGPRVRHVLFTYYRPGLIKHLEERRALLDGSGCKLSRAELGQLARACFGTAKKSRYRGVDRHVPSEFLSLYPDYISYQAARGRATNDTRLLLATEAMLAKDASDNGETFNRFYSAHNDNDIRLLQVEPTYAEGLRASLGLPSTDVAVFAWHYAVWYFPVGNDENDHECRVRIDEITSALKGQLKTYFSHLNERAKEVGYENRTLSCQERTVQAVGLYRQRLLAS